MKKLFIAVAIVFMAGCSSFGLNHPSEATRHSSMLDPIYQGGG